MKFVDEATIRVEAGHGGDGALSFRREKFVPRGGPDGGDGGNGGSVFIIGREALNTLVDFRHTRVYRAANGAKGGGGNCTGKSGEDLYIPVPLGTRVMDAEAEELIGEITRDGETLLVAHGGKSGLGNTRFKSSTNRSPRRTIPGRPGEHRELALELQVLADVGLLGLPNAGKSTFLRAVSEARPKVADYPFTTLHPHLGVVRIEPGRNFVVADLPGLIEGAAQGAGLGHRFLRHLARTRILLHMVDMAPPEPATDPVAGIEAIEAELRQFGAGPERGKVSGAKKPGISRKLHRRERWLVLNKMDLLPDNERELRVSQLVKKLKWKGPVYRISAINREGCRELAMSLMQRLENMKKKTKQRTVTRNG